MNINDVFEITANGRKLTLPLYYCNVDESNIDKITVLMIDACKDYKSAYEWLVNNMKLTKNGKTITVYTRDELFQALFTAMLAEKQIPNGVWDKVRKCEFCHSTFIRTGHEKYCCKQCAKDANKAKTLLAYYARKGVK